MIRKKKKYKKPQKKYDVGRIAEENRIIKEYGLKNKKELWKAEAKIDKLRTKAKSLITAEVEDQAEFIEKLKKKGFKVETIADVLALNREDILKRRLQTLVADKKFSPTIKGARQLITHRHIKVNGKIVNVPSYHVSLEEEQKIEVSLKNKKKAEEGKENKLKREEK